jgi:hypothetical protein
MGFCNKRRFIALGTVAQTAPKAMRRASFAFAFLIYYLQPAAAIVGGASQTDGSPRYHVVFFQDSKKNSCTGTAVTRELVLTAAQCADPDRKYKIISVDSDHLSVPINVTRVEQHPNFSLQEYSQSRASVDLALLKLATPLPLADSCTAAKSIVMLFDRLVGRGRAAPSGQWGRASWRS